MLHKARRAGFATAAVCVLTAATIAPAAHAFDFKIKGRVNKAIIAADNGEDADVGFVDNNSSESRFGFEGSQTLDNAYTLGFEYVIGLGDNLSDEFDVNRGSQGEEIANRQANVYIKGAFGKFTLGKQDGAANSTSKVDLSGTTDLGGGVPLEDYAGGISFLADDGSAGPELGNVLNSFDGLSRVNAVRYDTPSFGGVTVSASFDEDQSYEFAPRFERSFDSGLEFAAALDYVNSGQRLKDIAPDGSVNDDAEFEEYGGSASVLLPIGLNFTASYKKRSFDGADTTDPQTYFGGIGYIVGDNHFQVSYASTDDLYADGSKGTAYGAAYRYDLFEAVNLYAAYHLLSADDLGLAGGDAQDINNVLAGVRVKFF